MSTMTTRPAGELMTEREAARLALQGTRWQRARFVRRTLRALMKDPDNTRNVFLLGLAANAEAFPRLLLRFLSTEEGDRLLQERPAIDGRSVDFAALRALPADTLGGAYARFLDEKRLDPDLFQAPEGLPRAVAYIAQRVRQSHDLWHVLTGYDVDVPGEIILQAFTYAQTRMPSSLLIAVLGTLRWGLQHPRLFPEALRSYRRGKAARFLPVVPWEDLWTRPLAEVRASLGIAEA